MAIATVDDIAAALAVAQRQNYLKNIGAAKAVGAFQSAWRAAGKPGAAAAPPAYTAGAGYTCDRATVGALAQSNGAVKNWLAAMSALGSQMGTLILYDRLWQCSGIPFGAGTYAITTPGNLPTRITDAGVGCELWVENDVAAGAASGTLTATYVEPGAATGHTGVIGAVVSAPVAGQMQPVPLQAGDTGIKQLTNVITSATWTSGSFGLMIAKRIAEVPIGIIGGGNVLDWAMSLNEIPADACLAFALLANVTTAATVLGTIKIIDK